MHTVLTRLRTAFPFAGERSATEDDFFTFCAERRIEVVFTPEVSWGIYAVCRGEHFIFLNSRLSDLTLLYVMFHELGHYLFHVPGLARDKTAVFGWNCGR